jgi:hypothetical protein
MERELICSCSDISEERYGDDVSNLPVSNCSWGRLGPSGLVLKAQYCGIIDDEMMGYKGAALVS